MSFAFARVILDNDGALDLLAQRLSLSRRKERRKLESDALRFLSARFQSAHFQSKVDTLKQPRGALQSLGGACRLQSSHWARTKRHQTDASANLSVFAR